MKVGAVILVPATSARSPVPKVASLHHVIQADPGVTVVVVIGLPDVPERVERQLVRIAKIVTQYCQVGSIGIHSQSRPRVKRPTPSAHEAFAALVRDIEALIAAVKVIAAIRAESDRVQA